MFVFVILISATRVSSAVIPHVVVVWLCYCPCTLTESQSLKKRITNKTSVYFNNTLFGKTDLKNKKEIDCKNKKVRHNKCMGFPWTLDALQIEVCFKLQYVS